MGSPRKSRLIGMATRSPIAIRKRERTPAAGRPSRNPRLRARGGTRLPPARTRGNAGDGELARLFGASRYTAMYIAGVVIVALILVGGISTVAVLLSSVPEKAALIAEYWRSCLGLVGATLGFFFGRFAVPPRRVH